MKTWRAHLPFLALVAGLALVAFVVRVAPLGRSGFSPDEELTLFAARGIASQGLPRLPSGAVYDRGIAYSYAAWAAGRLFGDGLPSYRLPSLLAGCVSVPLTAVLAFRLGGSALLAGLLSCFATWLIVASTWARFYGLFLACFLATVLVSLLPGARTTRDRAFLLGLIVTRLLHESAVALLALPLFLLLGARAERRENLVLLVRSLLALGLVQVVLYGLQGDADAAIGMAATDLATLLPPLALASSPVQSSTGLALTAAGALLVAGLLWRLRVPLPLRLAGIACSATLSLGLWCAITLAFVLALPAGAGAIVAYGVLTGLASLALWMAQTVAFTDAGASLELLLSLAMAGLAFPSSAFRYAAQQWPLASVAALVGLGVGFRRLEVRAVAFLALGLLVFLGALRLGPKPRYFLPLFPLLFILASLAPGLLLTLGVRLGRLRSWTHAGLVAALAVVLLVEHEQGGRDTLLLERPVSAGLSRLRTAPYERWTRVLRQIAPEGPLLCNDDLACLLVVGRADYWWLGSRPEVQIYGAWDGSRWRGVYTGAPIVGGSERAAALTGTPEPCPAWAVDLDTVKYGFDDLPLWLSSQRSWAVESVHAEDGLRLLKITQPATARGRYGKEGTQCRTS